MDVGGCSWGIGRCRWGVGVHAVVCVWRPEDNLKESVLSYCIDTSDETGHRAW